MGTNYTLLLWFVNRGSRGDLRETHGSRDVPISLDEVGSRKGSERKRSEQGGVVRGPCPPCSNIPLDHGPNHFRRDVGQASVRADLGNAYRRRFYERILPVTADNSEKI